MHKHHTTLLFFLKTPQEGFTASSRIFLASAIGRKSKSQRSDEGTKCLNFLEMAYASIVKQATNAAVDAFRANNGGFVHSLFLGLEGSPSEDLSKTTAFFNSNAETKI